MYIIDYKDKTVAKFKNKELSDFLNSGFEKTDIYLPTINKTQKE